MLGGRPDAAVQALMARNSRGFSVSLAECSAGTDWRSACGNCGNFPDCTAICAFTFVVPLHWRGTSGVAEIAENKFYVARSAPVAAHGRRPCISERARRGVSSCNDILPFGVLSLMKIEPKIAAASAELTAIRRDIHAHPELGFEEERTSEIVAKKLKEWGCEVTTGIGKTGVVGTIRVGNNPRAIGLRADMDALPMDEHNTFDHRSQHKGRMHACGHDGHTTMLLGAAKYLSATRNFDGTVHLIFQPAEEGRGGAAAMVKDGLFEKFPCEQIFGMHNRPKLDVGKFAIRSGPQMAGGGLFDIKITGKGAHGARPETGIDPVIIATQIISALQSVVSRNVAPLDSAVISVTQMHAGDAYNVIPQEAVLRGTIRAFRKETMALIKERIETISRGIAKTLGGQAEPDVRIAFPPLVNDKDSVKFIADVAAEIVGEENMNREGPYVMASEDFSYMLEKVPRAFINIGNGGGEGGCEVHNPGYDFNDEIITLGATLWSRVVETKLAKDAR